MSSRPILIVGGEGQMGVALTQRRTLGALTLITRSRAELDITDREKIEEALDELAPACVINAAAYTAVDRAEGDSLAAYAVNSIGPHLLASSCASRSIPIVHFSTDYVFNGQQALPYLETDEAEPLSVYGASKLKGEEHVRSANSQHIILRTAWIFGTSGSNFFKTMINLAAERELVSVVDDQYGTPTWAADVAGAVDVITSRILENNRCWGTYHLTNGGCTSWYGFADEIFRNLARRGLQTPTLKAIASHDYPALAARPRRSVLDNTKVREVFGIQLPSWQSAVSCCFDRIKAFDT